MQCPISEGPHPRVPVGIHVSGAFEVARTVCMTVAEQQDLAARLASADRKVVAAARCEALNLALAKPGEPVIDVRNPIEASAVLVQRSAGG